MPKKQSEIRDLPQWLTIGLPLTTLALIPMAFVSPELFETVIAYESTRFHEEGALAILENLTVVLLMPAIIAGMVIWVYHRKKCPERWVSYWILGWTAALVFFAGEEISWGQWFFHWTTPEWFAEVNRQGETNLHNLSSWLNQKPRVAVSLWLIIAGFFLPLTRLLKSTPHFDANTWQFWVLPSKAAMTSAAVYLVFRIADWMPWDAVNQFGTSEIREYCIAVFLMVYMLSAWYRIRALS